MINLDEKFQKCIRKNSEIIEDKICHLVNEENLCPACEGVPCSECIKYALKILSK
jgi:hypothetical protein